MIWAGVVALGVLLGILSAIYTFLPKISITPTSTLDPSNPFQTPFVLVNESPLPLNSVGVGILVVELVDDAGNQMLKNVKLRAADPHFGGIPTHLKPRQKVPIGLENYIAHMSGVKTVILQMEVHYKPMFYPKSIDETFKFKALKSTWGEMIWFPLAN